MGDADRSIPATPRRREAARQQGAAPTAAVPAFVAAAAAAVLLLPGWSHTAVPAAAAYMRAALAAAFVPRLDAAQTVAVPPAALVMPTAALVLGALATGLTVRFLLDGSAWRLSRAAPRWQRIDPWAGCGRIFSTATLRGVLWNAACLSVFAVAAAFAAGPLVGLLRSSGPLVDADAAIATLRSAILPVLLAAAAVAAAQWGLARLAFERRLRMTPEEFREEMRGLEADPKVRLERQRRNSPAPPAPDSRSGR